MIPVTPALISFRMDVSLFTVQTKHHIPARELTVQSRISQAHTRGYMTGHRFGANAQGDLIQPFTSAPVRSAGRRPFALFI